MNKKRVSRRLKNFFQSMWAPFAGDMVLMAIFFALALAFSADSDIKEVFGGIFANGVAISVVLVEIMILIIGRIQKRIDISLEESEKTADDHHSIIRMYRDYKPIKESERSQNYSSETGRKMTIEMLVDRSKKEKRMLKQYKEMVHDAASEIDTTKREINEFVSKRVVEFPDVNIFTNVEGNVQIHFEDKPKEYQLPNFIESNAISIMEAHKTSKSKNVETIRLSGHSYNEEAKSLTLKTGRTCYNHMLLTNRCMDFPIGTDLSIREIYEYRSQVLPLPVTKMGNQIGIEGLIITTDGMTLIEKRNHSQRTTWRDKFAQPISLSMKKSDIGLEGRQTLEETHEAAQAAFQKMLKKHLEGFGLRMYEEENPDAPWDYRFELSRNFLGISRDLLEGGKPNMYFYVVVNCTGEELAERLEEAARPDDSMVKEENLDRKYYVYPLDKIAIDYNYIMDMDLKYARRVYRRRDSEKENLDSLKGLAKERHNRAKMRYRTKVKKIYEKECGEAFLGCLSYYELCKDRIQKEQMELKDEIQKKEVR